MNEPAATAVARPSRSARTLKVAGVVLVVALLATAGWGSWRDLGRARDREAALEGEIAATEERIEQLEERIERLKGDPLLLERLAREELGLARDGDVVILLPPLAPPRAARDPVGPPPRAARDPVGPPPPAARDPDEE